MEFEVGNRIEIADPDKIWSSATVHEVDKRRRMLTVRYDGWDTDWNEKVPFTSKRLSPIYSHTARVKCLAKLPFQSKKSKHKKGSKSKIRIELLWPCVLNLRMPSDKAGEAHLATEKNVFIEPYRPDLLPRYIKKDWKNGGMWQDTSTVNVWESIGKGHDVNEATAEENKEFFSSFPTNFQQAYELARDDKRVPGTLNEPPFRRGSLIINKFKAFKTKTGWANAIVDLEGWTRDKVDPMALQKILPVGAIKLEGSDDAATAPVSATKDGSKKRKAEPDPTVKSARVRTQKQTSLQEHEDENIAKAISESLADESAVEDTTYEAGNSAIPPGVEIKDSIYPGYHITYSEVQNKKKWAGPGPQHQQDESWIATVRVRGNEVHLGKFSSQTEAKAAVDNHYNNSRRKSSSKTDKSKEGEKEDVSSDDNQVAEDNKSDDSDFVNKDDDDTANDDDELEIDINSVDESDTGENISSDMPTRQSVAVQSSPYSKENARDADISAVSLNQAASIGYRKGTQLQGTGFSLHDWALVVINDTEKAKWRGKFQEMKRARLRNTRNEGNGSISK